MIRGEVQRLLDRGLTPDAALGAASWTARDWLRLPGFDEGAPADVVAYRDDPRQDPAVLADPILVILDGQLLADHR